MTLCHTEPFSPRIHGYDERAPRALLALILVLAGLAIAGILIAIVAPAPPIDVPYFTT